MIFFLFLPLTGCLESTHSPADESSTLPSERPPQLPIDINTMESLLKLKAEGETIYSKSLTGGRKCSSCHQTLSNSPIRGTRADDIKRALLNSFMSGITLDEKELFALELALTDKPLSWYLNDFYTPPVNHPDIPKDDPEEPEVTVEDLACTPGEDPAPRPLKRLSRKQYLNSLIYFSSSKFRQTNIYRALGVDHISGKAVGRYASNYSTMPLDHVENAFSRMDYSTTSDHLFTHLVMASVLSEDAINNTASIYSREVASSCQSTPWSDNCWNRFFGSVGLYIFRRPLKESERQDYKDLYQEFIIDGHNGAITAVMQAMLMSPYFTHQVEVEGTPKESNSSLLEITDLELITRITLSLNDVPPSLEQLRGANNGAYDTSEEVYDLVSSLTRPGSLNPRDSTWTNLYSQGQRTYFEFYKEWVGYNEIEAPDLSDTANQRTFHQLLPSFTCGSSTCKPASTLLNVNAKFGGAITAETREFYYRMFWKDNYGIADFFTNDEHYVVNYAHALSLGDQVPYEQAGSVTSLVRSVPGKAGILTRAAFLSENSSATNPIRRGVKIRERFLCDDLSFPDADELPDRALASPEITPNATTRQRYAAKTSGASCMSCHALINPLGFALENFSNIGVIRSIEHIYDFDQDSVLQLYGTPSIDAFAENLLIGQNAPTTANGGVELSQALAQSDKVRFCAARQIFRFTTAKAEAKGDGCQLLEAHESLKTGQDGFRGAIKQIILHPNFRLLKIGEQ